MKQLTETYITIYAGDDDYLFFQLGDSQIYTDEDHQEFYQAEDYADFCNWVEKKYEITIDGEIHQTHAEWLVA